jgi:hypothetical protein
VKQALDLLVAHLLQGGADLTLGGGTLN